jgi:sulfate/thiosulfate transport system substrate-binding protein
MKSVPFWPTYYQRFWSQVRQNCHTSNGMKLNRTLGLLAVALSVIIAGTACSAPKKLTLLNVSYDPTREFYQEFNTNFAKHWKAQTGEDVQISMSNGGSGKQARAVIDGLAADVVTLALAYDIDAIAQNGKLLPKDWQTRLANNSSPYTSTIVFLVRKGNPKGIKDWDDLGKPGISIVTPNPKTSGGARWNYLAAYGFELKRSNNDQNKAKQFVQQVFRNVSVLDSGARGSTVTFLQRGVGDVLIAWENEALLAANQLAKGQVEIITPSVSILAEPPVAVVDKIAKRRGTTRVAEEYLKFLYTEAGQQLAAKHYFRPRKEGAESGVVFAQVKLFTIDELFGGWQKAHTTHFAEGGTFDQIYGKK